MGWSWADKKMTMLVWWIVRQYQAASDKNMKREFRKRKKKRKRKKEKNHYHKCCKHLTNLFKNNIIIINVVNTLSRNNLLVSQGGKLWNLFLQLPQRLLSGAGHRDRDSSGKRWCCPRVLQLCKVSLQINRSLAVTIDHQKVPNT